jgi:hypothetical protein
VAKTAAKRPARKKKSVRKSATRGKKKVATGRKSTGKKAGKKKSAKRVARKDLASVQAKLEKRVQKLTDQLDEMRAFVKKELALDLQNTRKYADAEMAIQKRRFDQILDKIKRENRELQERMSKYVQEHEVLKGVTKGAADAARALEERVRKIMSKEA